MARRRAPARAAANSKSSPVLPTARARNSSHVASLSGIKLELLSNLLVVLSDIIVRVEMIDSNFTQLSRSHGIDLAWITSLPASHRGCFRALRVGRAGLNRDTHSLSGAVTVALLACGALSCISGPGNSSQVRTRNCGPPLRTRAT